MGTRAIIMKNGKPFIATHWDGYPESLGMDLKSARTDSEIIAVAKKHTIDSADSSVREKLNDERVKELAKKFRLSEAKIRQGYIRGNIQSAGDYEIGHIENYGDWAEFQYSLKDGVWYYRALSGEYPTSLNGAGDYKKLSSFKPKKATVNKSVKVRGHKRKR